MDIQYILDPYACVGYIIDYIGKSQKGISKIIKNIADEVRNEKNDSIKNQLRTIVNTFINKSEISAQEISYHLLNIPLSFSSRKIIYIDTSPSEERTRLLKSNKELKALFNEDPDSTDITKNGLIEYYINRPTELENICLADFAANYNFYYKTVKEKTFSNINYYNDEINDDNISDEIHNSNNATNISFSNNCNKFNYKINNNNNNKNILKFKKVQMKLKNNLGYITTRKNMKIIRYRHYNIFQDAYNFFREQIMLFNNWRNINEFEKENVHQIYLTNIEIIKNNRQKYIKNDVLEENIENAINEYSINDKNLFEKELEDENEKYGNSPDEYLIFKGDFETNINNELFIKSDNDNFMQNITITKQLLDDEYYKLIRKLNYKQKKYHHNLVHLLKNNNDIKLYHFINGSAGVGKSVLIRAITQSILRYYNRIPGNDPNQIKLLLCAPTGKSAFNIGGITLHSAFRLPVNTSTMIPLSNDNLNLMNIKLRCLKFLIIDEISMVGSRIFHMVNLRLQEILQSKELFGGISVIVFGDFNQLKPVLDSWIFNVNKKDDLSLLTGPYLWNLFSIYELDEIMRQKDDYKFAEMLTRLANNTLTKNDHELFYSREISKLTKNNG